MVLKIAYIIYKPNCSTVVIILPCMFLIILYHPIDTANLNKANCY